jgi:hypothetical protein
MVLVEILVNLPNDQNLLELSLHCVKSYVGRHLWSRGDQNGESLVEGMPRGNRVAY